VAADFGLAAQSLAVLCAGGEVEFSGFGLRDCAAGAAAFCGFALPKLVSEPGVAPGGVEGTDVPGVGPGIGLFTQAVPENVISAAI